MKFTRDEAFLLDLLTRLFGTISLIACTTVICAYIFLPPFHTSVVSRLAAAIAVADFISVFAETIGRIGSQAGPDAFICQYQAFTQQLGELITIFVVVAISINLLAVVKFDRQFKDVRAFDKFWIAIAIVMAALLSIIPFNVGAYGDSGLWCWIPGRHRQYRWLLYGPLFAAIVFCTIVGLVVHFTLREREKEDAMFAGFSVDDPSVNALPEMVWLYLVVFIVTWGPVGATQVFRIFYPNSPEFTINLMLAVFLPLRGLLNSFVAFYLVWRSRKFRSKLRSAGVKEGGAGAWWEDLDARVINRISYFWK